MGDVLGAGLTALWLGILTSVSPCPLATNIAAISYVAKGVEKPRRVLLSGLLYTFGRTVAYVTLGVLLVHSLFSVPYVSNLLQKYANKILGPLLIVVGMLLLGLIRVTWPSTGMAGEVGKRSEKMGLWGAGFLGIVFALSFCPVSAALFFGTLLPLAAKHNSSVFLPLLYGVGTALPVVGFAVVIAVSTKALAATYSRVTTVERWARGVTGVVFIGVGVYLTLAYVFGVSW